MLVLSAILLGTGACLWWLSRSQLTHRVARVVGSTLGCLLVALGAGAAGLLAWAHTATDTSQLARTIVWGDSAFGDQDRFPARTITADSTVRPLQPTEGSALLDAYRHETGRDLDRLASDSGTTALLVLRGDSLLHERYFNGSDAADLQTSFSVAKSVTAALVGIAVQEGSFPSLDAPITEFVPALALRDGRFGQITLRHLLTMSSGISFDAGDGPWDDPANTYHGTDLRSAAVSSTDIEDPAGERFLYNDWNVILLGMALEEATAMSVSDYTASRLWGPMGAEADGSWSLDSERHGFEKMFVGVNATARDFVRFGALFRDRGRAGGVQVIPEAYVNAATRHDDRTDPASDYQYLWWIDEAHDAYYALGDHGQFVYVHPQTDLVIVRHGAGPGDVEWLDVFREIVRLVATGAIDRAEQP